jgi:hypothetical protein
MVRLVSAQSQPSRSGTHQRGLAELFELEAHAPEKQMKFSTFVFCGFAALVLVALFNGWQMHSTLVTRVLEAADQMANKGRLP